MKTTNVILLVTCGILCFILLCESMEVNEEKEDEFLKYPTEELHRMGDWNSWHKDYYTKVLQCPTKSIKSKQKRKCGKFRVCKKYCKSNYGVHQCRTRCRFKRNSIPKFLKVIYRVKRNGLCSDTAICLYKSRCNNMWPQYNQVGCYYTYDFNEWWKIHKKEYEVKKYPLDPSPADKKCTDNGPVKANFESTVKVRTKNGKLFFKIGKKWIDAKFKNGELYYNFNRRRINVRFQYNHQYFEIGGKWIRVVMSKGRIFAKISSLWVPIKILLEGYYIKLGNSWLKWEISNENFYVKRGQKWTEFKILNQDLYYKFKDSWYRIQQKRFNILMKLGNSLRKIITVNSKRYIELGKRWFEFKFHRKTYSIKIDKIWRKIIFRNKKSFIEIKSFNYPIRFRSVYMFLKLNKKWIRFEERQEQLFFRLNDIWVHLKLKGLKIYVKKNDEALQVYFNDKRKLFYKFKDDDSKISVVLKNLDKGETFPLENFYKVEKAQKKKFLGGYWLRYKKKGEHYYYKLFDKWTRLNLVNGKMYMIKDNMDEYEIRILGKVLLLKLGNTWIEVRRKNKKLFFRDSNQWIRLKLKENKAYIRLMNKWENVIFKNRKIYLKYGKLRREIKLRKETDEEFHIKLRGKWFEVKYKQKKMFLRIRNSWVQFEFNKNGDLEILVKQKWFKFKLKRSKTYLKIGKKWIQFIVKNKTTWIKIGDTFKEIKINNNKISIIINNDEYEYYKERVHVNGERIKIIFKNGKLHQYFQKQNIPLKIFGRKMFIKIEDSWIERRMDKKGKFFIIVINNKDIKIMYDKAMLCEVYHGENIPMTIRFGKLYYNLDGEWVAIKMRKDERIAVINGKKISLKINHIRKLIKKYKKIQKSKCVKGFKRRYKNMRMRLKNKRKRKDLVF